MRPASSILIALGMAVLGGSVFAADSGPVIVIPGRLGTPVIINGVDVTGAVIEGDFGLNKPHMVAPRIISGPVMIPDRFGPRGYYPAFGRPPGYGRHEIETAPERRAPPPSFHRSWSSQSDPVPATLDPPPQPLLLAPQIYPQGPRNGRRP